MIKRASNVLKEHLAKTSTLSGDLERMQVINRFGQQRYIKGDIMFREGDGVKSEGSF